ncbi:MAG: glycoside hydrolase family 15 protein [Nanoarchaeota archaeon]
MKTQISELLKISKTVIADCALPNGAIVAANSSKSYFPKEAKNYRYVWPRDALYICMAANILGLNIEEKFFSWCMKAEGWKQTGLFYEKYFVNGKKARHHFQPDQTGSILIALFNYYKHTQKKCSGDKFEELIKKSAEGLCKVWDTDHFKIVTQDLWEERLCFPDLEENFTYSLAICSRGLFCANELIPNPNWLKTAQEMKNVLLNNFKDQNYFYRSAGKINDLRVDASLLGLVWPSRIIKADGKRMKKTVQLIEKKLVKTFGLYRYEHDNYDGWMYKNNTSNEMHRKKGAGYWPLLNFWMTIYYAQKYKDISGTPKICKIFERLEKSSGSNNLNDRKKAAEYYHKVLSDLTIRNTHFIPEQIFNNNIQVAVSPLCWSHAMFVIATKKLGFV